MGYIYTQTIDSGCICNESQISKYSAQRNITHRLFISWNRARCHMLFCWEWEVHEGLHRHSTYLQWSFFFFFTCDDSIISVNDPAWHCAALSHSERWVWCLFGSTKNIDTPGTVQCSGLSFLQLAYKWEIKKHEYLIRFPWTDLHFAHDFPVTALSWALGQNNNKKDHE